MFLHNFPTEKMYVVPRDKFKNLLYSISKYNVKDVRVL